MKLVFTKKENGDIEVLLEKGTSLIPFNYVEMLRQLLEHNEISEDCTFDGLEQEEIDALKSMLYRISEAIKKGYNENQ